MEKKEQIYAGQTQNITVRFFQHLKGEGANCTKILGVKKCCVFG